MYLSNKKHILSNTLIAATVIQFISVIIQLAVQSVMQGGQDGMPSAAAWSSVGFNVISTAGMIIFALYLRIRYRGV